jgi:citrate lyase gamma subunit
MEKIMKDIERIIEQVNASLSMEGMPLTSNDKSALRSILNGSITASEMKAKIISDYGLKLINE